MTGFMLAPDTTDQGAMERVFLLETADPAQGIYDRVASLKAMRWMKQVVDNRLAAPRKSRFGEPNYATTETDIVSVGSQFAGFGDYPQLSADFQAKLYSLVHIANSKSDRRSKKYAGFIEDAIRAATEPAPPTEAKVTNLAAWRTAGSHPPGGEFKLVGSLQGNDFYSASPVSPMVARQHRHRHTHRH